VFFILQASDRQLLWVQRVAIVLLGGLATLISLFVPHIYVLFILAADVVYVIVLPQLHAALFLKFTNAYGALLGYIIGVVLRVGAGSYELGLPPFIHFHEYVPVRTLTMLVSLTTIIVVSLLTNVVFKKGLLPRQLDVFHVSDPVSYSPASTSGDVMEMTAVHPQLFTSHRHQTVTSIPSVDRISDSEDQISNSVDRISDSEDQISNSVDQISNSVEQISNSVEQISNSVEQISDSNNSLGNILYGSEVSISDTSNRDSNSPEGLPLNIALSNGHIASTA